MDATFSDTQDVDIRLKQLTIASSRSQAYYNPQNNSSSSRPNITAMPTRRRSKKGGRSKNPWFNELHYGQRPPAESPAQSPSSAEPKSGVAHITSTWYDKFEGDNGVSSRMLAPRTIPASSRQVKSGHDQQSQNSRQDQSWAQRSRHIQSSARSTDGDIEDLSDSETEHQDIMMCERQQQEHGSPRSLTFQPSQESLQEDTMMLETQQQEHIPPRSLTFQRPQESSQQQEHSPPRNPTFQRPQESLQQDLDDDEYSIYMPADPEPAHAQLSNTTSAGSNDPVSVLVQRLDVIQQSCLEAVREGIDKITDSIITFQNTVSTRVPENNIIPRKVKKVKRTGFPVRRSNETRHRQKNLREYLTQLLAQGASPFVEAADAQAFHLRWNNEDDAPRCCTIDSFQVDLHGNPRSAWNRSASQVFARAYCDFYEVPLQTQPEALVDVAEGFLKRVKALKFKYRAQNLSNSEQLKLLQGRRRRTRKTTLFHRRLEAAGEHPQLQHHSEILQRLGIDGMSSDESDYEELPTNPPAAMRPPRYYVMRPRWRSDSLTDWLETFDVVYNIMRRESLSRRGAYARRRVQNSTATAYSQSRSFVPHLPINAYDQAWLSGRRDVAFSIIPTDAYNFTHSSEVISYMRGTVLALAQDR